MKKEIFSDPTRERAIITAMGQVYGAAYAYEPSTHRQYCEERAERAVKSFLKVLKESGI